MDFDDDGTVDSHPWIRAPTAFTYNSQQPRFRSRYFVEIQTNSAQTYTDDILITFFGVPGPIGVDILDDLSDQNNIEIVVQGGGSYEYAINGGPFQDSPIFHGCAPWARIP